MAKNVIKLSNSDIKSMVNEAIDKLIREGYMKNPQIRVAVVRNIYNKHHAEDPSYTWDDAVEHYINNYQKSLEFGKGHGKDNFTAGELHGEIVDYAKQMSSLRKSDEEKKKAEGDKYKQETQECADTIMQMMSKLGLNPNRREYIGDVYLECDMETEMCDGNGPSSEFIVSNAEKAVQLFDMMNAAGIKSYGWPSSGIINVYVPGSDSHSSRYVITPHGHHIYGLGKNLTPDELVGQIENTYSWPEVVDKLTSVTAKMSVRVAGRLGAGITLTYDGTFNEDGEKLMKGYWDSADASVEHDRAMGWSLD